MPTESTDHVLLSAEESRELLAADEGDGNSSQQTKSRASPDRPRWFLPTAAQIIISAAVISIPLVLLSVILLVIIFRYRLQNTRSSSSSALSSNIPQDEANVYYVNFSATKLVLLASLSSSTAPLLTNFFLTLVSYPVSRRILTLSSKRKLTRLPTPHQLGLLIYTLNGGFGALWKWAEHVFRKRETTVDVVKISAWGLATANVLTYV